MKYLLVAELGHSLHFQADSIDASPFSPGIPVAWLQSMLRPMNFAEIEGSRRD